MARGGKLHHGFGIRQRNYRDRCYDYVRDNGPCTAHEMYSEVRTAKGTIPKCMPASPISLSQILRRDHRFYVVGSQKAYGFTGDKTYRQVWGIKEEEE
jgi:hypothetical protein